MPVDSDRVVTVAAADTAAGDREIGQHRLGRRSVELLWLAGALLCTALLTGYRVSVARSARFPGHADPAFSFGVAQNIHAGRGQTIDYIWQFLVPAGQLNHYAFDYWLPLPSQLMALALRYGRGLPAALDMNIAMVVLMAAGSYLLARAHSELPWVPAVAAVVVQLQPVVSTYALQAESAVYFAGFAIPAVAAAAYARRYPAGWVVAGGFAALAAMCRSEGLLLCLVLGVAALAWTERSRWFVRVGLLLLGYLPVSAPFLAANLSHFGSPMPPAAAAFPFITQYEDLFSLHVHRSLHGLLGTGLHDFVHVRAAAFNAQASAAFQALSPLIAVLCLMLAGWTVFAVRTGPRSGAGDRWALLRGAWFVPIAFGVLVFCVDALVAPVVSGAGATTKVMVAGVPLIVVPVVVGLAGSWLPGRVTAVICAALIVLPLITLGSDSNLVVRRNNMVGDTALAVLPALTAEQACLNTPLVLMTRNPWEYNQATGYPTVQIPNGSLAEILAIARKYRVTDLLLPTNRPALADINRQLGAGGAFSHPHTLTGHQIYRITSTTAGSRC